MNMKVQKKLNQPSFFKMYLAAEKYFFLVDFFKQTEFLLHRYFIFERFFSLSFLLIYLNTADLQTLFGAKLTFRVMLELLILLKSFTKMVFFLMKFLRGFRETQSNHIQETVILCEKLLNSRISGEQQLNPFYVTYLFLYPKETENLWQMFFNIGVLRNFANFTGKHLCQSLFLIKLQAFRFPSL